MISLWSHLLKNETCCGTSDSVSNLSWLHWLTCPDDISSIFLLFVCGFILFFCFYSGDASSLHWCPVPILNGHWPPATYGCHGCHIPRCSCTIHDSDRRPSLPHWDRPASKHHCYRSRTHFVYHLLLFQNVNILDIVYLLAGWGLIKGKRKF